MIARGLVLMSKSIEGMHPQAQFDVCGKWQARSLLPELALVLSALFEACRNGDRTMEVF